MQFDHFEIVGIAIEAGLSIMDVYDSSVQIEVQSKEDDSPLTKADIAAHKTITPIILRGSVHSHTGSKPTKPTLT